MSNPPTPSDCTRCGGDGEEPGAPTSMEERWLCDRCGGTGNEPPTPPAHTPDKYVVFPTGGEAVIVRKGGDGEMVSVDFDEVGRVLAERDRLRLLIAQIEGTLTGISVPNATPTMWAVNDVINACRAERAALAAAKGVKS